MRAIDTARIMVMKEMGVTDDGDIINKYRWSNTSDWTKLFYLLKIQGIDLGFNFNYIVNLISDEARDWLMEEFCAAKYNFETGTMYRFFLSKKAAEVVKTTKRIIAEMPEKGTFSMWLYTIVSILYFAKDLDNKESWPDSLKQSLSFVKDDIIEAAINTIKKYHLLEKKKENEND